MASKHLWWMMTAAVMVSACAQAPDEAPLVRHNIEVSGTAECLSQVTHNLSEMGIGMGVPPVWRNHIGTMEFSEVAEKDHAAAVKAIRAAACVGTLARRPCDAGVRDYTSCPFPAER